MSVAWLPTQNQLFFFHIVLFSIFLPLLTMFHLSQGDRTCGEQLMQSPEQEKPCSYLMSWVSCCHPHQGQQFGFGCVVLSAGCVSGLISWLQIPEFSHVCHFICVNLKGSGLRVQLLSHTVLCRAKPGVIAAIPWVPLLELSCFLSFIPSLVKLLEWFTPRSSNCKITCCLLHSLPVAVV